MNEVTQKVKDRLCAFIDHLGLSVSAFEKQCGLSNGYVRNFKGNLGVKKLEDILSAFPQLNKEWLLFGTGSMLISSEDQPENPVEEKPETVSQIDKLIAIVDEQRVLISQLFQAMKEKDEKILELLDELLIYKQHKGETARNAGDSSSANVG